MKKLRIYIQSNKAYLILFLISFVLFFFVSQCAPLRGDDMEFIGHRFSSAIDVFRYSLYYGNGRLLGNFIGVSLVYSKIATSIIKALAVSSIITLLPKVLVIKNTPTLIISFILFAGCSAIMFGEVFVSVCAFSNYVIPISLTLFIVFIYKFGLRAHSKRNAFIAISIFVLGIAAQLFAEHTTIINIAVSLVICLYAFICKQKRCCAIIYFISSVLGAVFMFAIPRVFYMAENRVEGYRSVNLNSVSNLLSSINDTFLQFVGWIFNSNLFIGLVFVLMILTVIIKRDRIKKPYYYILLFCSALCLTYYYCKLLFIDIESYGVTKRICTILNYTFVIGFIVLLFCCFYLSFKVKFFSVEVVITILWALSLLPLFVVSPVRSRCFFQAYVFGVAFLLLWIDRGFSNKTNGILLSANIALLGVATSLCISIIITSASLRWLDNIRRNHIIQEMKNNAKTIEVFTIDSDYENSDNNDFYGKQYYYNTWNDIDFETIGQDEWIKKYR